MPVETIDAVIWAMTQVDPVDGAAVTVETEHWLVHMVRQWFNDHGVTYSGFAYADLVPFLPQITEPEV